MIMSVLDPTGRMGPGAFRDAAITLILIGAVISLLPWINSSLMSLTYASFLLIYPWIVIWIKRFHDAGKSGWMFLTVLVPWLIVGGVVSRLVIIPYFAPDFASARPTDIPSALANARALQESIALPGTIFSVIFSSIVTFGVNALLKSDPGPNAYDPPPHMR